MGVRALGREVREMDMPLAYLYRVGQSRSRRLRRRTPVFLATALSATNEIDPRLIPALVELPPRQRVAVWLVHGHDWTHRDVATLLDIDASTVATHVAVDWRVCGR